MKKQPHKNGVQVSKTKYGFRWSAFQSGRSIGESGRKDGYRNKKDMFRSMETLRRILTRFLLNTSAEAEEAELGLGPEPF
jgi:hypothetical protein